MTTKASGHRLLALVQGLARDVVKSPPADTIIASHRILGFVSDLEVLWRIDPTLPQESESQIVQWLLRAADEARVKRAGTDRLSAEAMLLKERAAALFEAAVAITAGEHLTPPKPVSRETDREHQNGP